MRAAFTIAGRDVRAMFGSPFGFGLAAGYLLVSGLLLVLALDAGEARLDGWFAPLFLVTAVLCALLTMRSFAEEERSGSLELLLSSPIRPVQVVVGKVLGAVAVLLVIGVGTLAAPAVVAAIANPDGGPILTGYLGLLLLGALCCAVGVAASTATDNQLVAGAVSGGLLLGLWFAASAASVLPSSVAAGLRYASPSSHVIGFLRGTLSVVDLVAFATFTIAAVVVAAVVARARRAHRWRRGAAVLAGVVALVVVANVAAARSTSQVDLSANSRFTLSAETRQVAKAVTGPMKVTAFLYGKGGEASDARFLLDRYHELNDHISYSVVDPDESPSVAKRYGISGYSTVVVEYQGRRVDVPDVSESQVSSAILRALRGTTHSACALSGHGEPRFDDDGPAGLSHLSDLLATNGYKVTPLDLTSGAPVPSSCDLVLEVGPTVALTPAEINALVTYGHAAGRLLVLGNSGLDTDADLNPILNPWGISISQGLVIDPDRSVQGDPFGIVVQDFPSTNPVVQGVPSMELTLATGLLGQSDEGHGLTVSHLAQTSSSGYLDADGSVTKTPPDIAGPVLLAVAADDSAVESSGETRVAGDGARIVRTRIVAVGNSHFAENEFLDSFGNRRFLVNAMGWLAEEEQLLTVSTSPPQPRQLAWTAEHKRTVVAATMVAMPLCFLGLGVAQWARGRRRSRRAKPAR